MNLTLDGYIPIGEGINKLFAPYVEVVLHDLSSQQIHWIGNSFSNRSIGDPSYLEEYRIIGGSKVIGPYQKVNWDGRELKSISMVLCDSNETPIGMLCLNFDLSPWNSIRSLLAPFWGGFSAEAPPEALFKNDWNEKINIFVQKSIQKMNLNLSTLTRSQKKELVRQLETQGAFEGKHSAEYIGKVLGLSRATIYNYLATFHEER